MKNAVFWQKQLSFANFSPLGVLDCIALSLKIVIKMIKIITLRK